MNFSKQLIVILLVFSMLVTVAYAADLDYPYGRFRLKLPPSEDPFPGFGNYYSAISKGMKSALWNPASLGKIKLSEASLSTLMATETYDYERSSTLDEQGGDFEIGSGGGSPAGRYGIFYRYPQDIGTGLATQEIEVMSHANYATTSTGLNFSSALKVNDWITVGFATNNPFEVDMNLAGNVPTTTRAITNLSGQKIDEMEIDGTGKLKYTFTSDGTVTTYESTQAIWNGFLSQEATIPFISISEIRNNLNIQSPYTGTIASKFGNFYMGLNMIPIYATANINNDVRTVVSSDTEDILLYTPDFDPENETELATWINDPDQYSTSDGYRRKQIKLPAGEIVGTAKYRGFYAASTARFDLGGMYDITDWLTVGLVLENVTSSSLGFKGNGIATYMNYRDINTAEAENFEDLLKPGGKSSYDLASDRWVTTFEAGETKLYLEPEKTYDLPKRLRFGIALKKPFLIAIDFEQNQTPIKIKTTENDQPKEYIISNINLMRIGTETRLFMLPLWLQSGTTLLFKPTVTGLDADAQDSFDKAFQFGVLPLKIDMGINSNFWGTIVGGSLGVNGLGILNSMQFDATNLDLSKLVYYNIYVTRDAWQLSYLAQADPLATAAAYGNKTVPAGEDKKFEFSDLKFVQTLGVTYRF